MQHGHRRAAEFENPLLAQAGILGAVVAVAAGDGDWRDGCQLVDQVRGENIPGVEDGIHAGTIASTGERIEYLRPKLAALVDVRIREDAEAHWPVALIAKRTAAPSSIRHRASAEQPNAAA